MLFVNGRFLAQREVTGVQRVALELMSALDRSISAKGLPRPWKAIDVLVPGDAGQNVEYKNLHVRRIGNTTGQVWEQIELPWFTRSGVLVSLGNLGPVVKRQQAVMLHDAAVFMAPAGFTLKFRAWYKFVHRSLASRIPLFLTVSEFSRRQLSTALNIQAKDILVIRNGVNHVHRIREDLSIVDRLNTKDPFILAVASANPNKNMSVLYELAGLLSKYRVNIVLAGSRNKQVFARSPGNLTVGADNIHRVGRVTDEELKGLYKTAAAFVFPSIYEGFGLPPLEAMACGCPVVASSCASIPEVCADGALYFDPHDVDTLLSHVVNLTTDAGLRAKMVAAGSAVVSRYKWDRAGDEFYSALETIGRWCRGH